MPVYSGTPLPFRQDVTRRASPRGELEVRAATLLDGPFQSRAGETDAGGESGASCV